MRTLQPLHPGRARIVMKRELLTDSLLAHKLTTLDQAHTPPFRLRHGEKGLEIYDHNKRRHVKLDRKSYSALPEPPSLLIFPANASDRPGAHNIDNLIRALSGDKNGFTSSNTGQFITLPGEKEEYIVEAVQFYQISRDLVERVRSRYQEAW